jgi:hypothetical protein
LGDTGRGCGESRTGYDRGPRESFQETIDDLAAVSADGSSWKPMAIIQRKTYEIDLFDAGFTPDKAMIVHR